MKTLSLLELLELFGTDEVAEQWFIKSRWPEGLACAYCNGNRVGRRGNHPTQPFHCLDCMRFYSVKTNTVMHSSKLGYRKWAIAIYLFVAHPKGVSSLQLHRDLGITQKTAWHLGHRIREALETDTLGLKFEGPVEVDETFMGGRARNQPLERRRRLKKKPVIGMRDRATGKIVAKPIWAREANILQYFVRSFTKPTAEVYTDEAPGYRGMPRDHYTVNHSKGEYGLTNGHRVVLGSAQEGLYRCVSQDESQASTPIRDRDAGATQPQTANDPRADEVDSDRWSRQEASVR